MGRSLEWQLNSLVDYGLWDVYIYMWYDVCMHIYIYIYIHMYIPMCMRYYIYIYVCLILYMYVWYYIYIPLLFRNQQTQWGWPHLLPVSWHGESRVGFHSPSPPGSSGSGTVMEEYNFWLVVWLPFFIFPEILGIIIIPIDEIIYFQRGGPTTNQ